MSKETATSATDQGRSETFLTVWTDWALGAGWIVALLLTLGRIIRLAGAIVCVWCGGV
jgi:hypothetical protein